MFSIITFVNRNFVWGRSSEMAAIINKDWQSHYTTTHEKLSFLLGKDILSDVVFIVGEQEKEKIYAHKFVLMMGSSLFKNMLKSSSYAYSNKKKEEIFVPDISPVVFRALMKFDTDDVNSVMDLMIAAHKYKISQLMSQCSTVLISNITEKNVISIYQMAQFLDQGKLLDYAFDFICRKAKAVIMGPDICSLTKDNLKRLVKSDNLNTDEIELFKAVVKWARGTCQLLKLEPTKDNIREVLREIIHHIRFLIMSADEFSLHVASQDILTNDELVPVYMHNTLPIHMRPSPNTPSIFSPKPRNCFWVVERFTSKCTRTCWKNKARGWLSHPRWQSISFQSDQSIAVIGVGLYGETTVTIGEYFQTCRAYSYEIKITNDNDNVINCKEGSVDNPGKLYYAQLNKPVIIHPFKWYTISTRIKSNTASFFGEGGRPNIKVVCGNVFVNFKFKETLSPGMKLNEADGEKTDNETDVRHGEIPEIAFSLIK